MSTPEEGASKKRELSGFPTKVALTSYGGGMEDDEIAAAITHGGASGAAAFDQYAYGLYAYCRSQLAQTPDAATAVQDTFIIASAKLPMLREPGRMRAWLFAIARTQCQGRMQAAGSLAADMTHYAEAFTAGPQEAQLGGLVLTALGELKASEREILELNVRHELDGADLADILGVPRNRAETLAAETRSGFETSLGALLAASPAAEQSTRWASSPDDTLTGRRRPSDRSAAAMLGLLVPPAVPASLRQDVSHLLTDRSAGPTSYRERVIRRSKSFGADGFPVQLGSPAGFGQRNGRLMAATAAVAVLALVGGGAVFVKMSSGGSSPPAVTQPASSSSAGSTASSKALGRIHPARTAAPTPTPGVPIPGANQPVVVPPTAAKSKKPKPARKSSPPASKHPSSAPPSRQHPSSTPPSSSPPAARRPAAARQQPATASSSPPAPGGTVSLITVLLRLI